MVRPGEGVGSHLFVTVGQLRPTLEPHMSHPPHLFMYVLVNTYSHKPTVGHSPSFCQKMQPSDPPDGLSPRLEKLLNSIWLSSGTVPPGQQFNCLSADSALAHSHLCLSILFSETRPCQKPYSLQMNTSGSRNGMSFTSGGWLALPPK